MRAVIGPRPFDPAHPFPPARRATDRAITLLGAGTALLGWAVVARLLARGDMFGWVYLVPVLVLSWAALSLLRLVWKDRARRRAAERGGRDA